MFLGAGSRSKTSVRQKLVLKLAAALVNTTPSDGSVTPVKLNTTAMFLGSVVNGSIVASVAGNALTLALKTLGGADATASDPIYILNRNPTIASGVPNILTVTGAQSIVVSSGSTLGTQNGTPFRIWLVAFDDAGTTRLAVINCINAPGVPNIYPLGQLPIASSTAEGGAGAADSVWTFYTGTAVASKPYTILGYVTYETGLATAGTWNAGPTRIEVYKPWTPLPGGLISQVESRSGTSATGTTQVPNDDTIPQITEGDQYLTQAIQPTSASNVMRVQFQGNFTASLIDRVVTSLFQDAVASALASVSQNFPTANRLNPTVLDWSQLAASTASQTFRIRAGPVVASTVTFNGEAGARVLGGALASYLRVQELQG